MTGDMSATQMVDTLVEQRRNCAPLHLRLLELFVFVD